jgi:hypothetical protein
LLEWFFTVFWNLGLLQKDAKILFVGLNNVGKTARLLNMLKAIIEASLESARYIYTRCSAQAILCCIWALSFCFVLTVWTLKQSCEILVCCVWVIGNCFRDWEHMLLPSFLHLKSLASAG